jgi:hypothetical protein
MVTNFNAKKTEMVPGKDQKEKVQGDNMVKVHLPQPASG